jgi:hypothetical protein
MNKGIFTTIFNPESKAIKSIIDEKVEKFNDETSEEKWVWVDGYKGVTKNMTAYGDFKYELGKQYDMPDDAEIEECSSGFHLCLELKDVYEYCNIGYGHRFFKVKALVREKDRDKYGKYSFCWSYSRNDKLAAKSIILTEELTVDEIFEPLGYNHPDSEHWTEEYKKMALQIGIDAVTQLIRADELEALGYSSTFSKFIVQNKEQYEKAKAVGSQPDLSMDMKVFVLFNK